VKIRDEGFVRNKAVYIALGILADGTKAILGLWIEQTEGAKFWLRVMNDLTNRGVGDILIAVVGGLKGFPEAITAVFPDTVVQTCWGGRPPARHRCARMRSLKTSSKGDRPWNKLFESAWIRQSTSFSCMV
jgi:putative transposase